MDKVKILLAVALAAAGIFAFHYFGEQALVLRVLYVIAGFIAGAAVGWFTEPGRDFYAFARSSWDETRKVVWPTRREAVMTTGAVFLFVVTMAAFLWVTDKSLEWVLYDMILGWKTI